MRRVLLTSVLAAAAVLCGCRRDLSEEGIGLCDGEQHSSDERLRKALGIPESQELSEAFVAERLLGIIPVGTVEPEIAKAVAAMGVGSDDLSSYKTTPGGDRAVVRFEFDPATCGVVKSTWIITLHLDSSNKLRSISARRHLVGL